MNNNIPLVSVIVTTFNRKELLKETIDSILNQTFTDFELIVVDNYSSYDFLAYMKSFNDIRIRAFQNKNNGIIAVNRNFGIKKARCKYIAFCDDDDLWIDNKLAIQVELMQSDDIGICFTSSIYINQKAEIIGYSKIKDKYQRPTFRNFFLSGGYIVNSSVIIRSDYINNVGFINENPNLVAIEDSEYWARFLFYFKGCFISKYLVKYRIHDKNTQTNSRLKRLKKKYYYIRSLNKNFHVSWYLVVLKLIKSLF